MANMTCVGVPVSKTAHGVEWQAGRTARVSKATCWKNFCHSQVPSASPGGFRQEASSRPSLYYIYIYMYIYIYIYMCVCMYVYIYIYIFLLMSLCA